MLHSVPRSILLLAIVGGSVLGLTRAYFSDVETSAGNTFQAGKLDLKINGSDDPSPIISFSDLKPGDEKIFDDEILVDDNPAFVWMHIKDLVSGQGIQTEPEDEEENLNGIKFDIENFLTYDLSIGDTEIISLEDATRLTDAYSCWIPLGQLPGASPVNLHQSFHFDSTVTNWAQGDTLTFNEEFYATQVRNNPNATPPPSLTGRVWNDEEKKCVDSGAQLVDTIFVPSTSAGPTLSNIILQNGTNYRLDVSGTFVYWPSCPADGITPPCIADAEYMLRPASSYGPGWVKGENIDPLNSGGDILVNGNNIDWGTYTPSGLYSTTLTGNGSTATFSISDDVYSDNSGGLTVKIYELP